VGEVVATVPPFEEVGAVDRPVEGDVPFGPAPGPAEEVEVVDAAATASADSTATLKVPPATTAPSPVTSPALASCWNV
jgi:hypothetical protein